MSAESSAPSLIAHFVIGLITIYRYSLGYLLGGRCRFYPSCSAYGLQAVRRFGAGRGVWMTLKRLGRCQPWNLGGLDPVPELAPEGAGSGVNQ